MSLGIFLKGFNALYFRKTQDLLFEFIPQVFILWNLFLWMDILIVKKWLTPRYVDNAYLPTPDNYGTFDFNVTVN
jgi:V-type H+-transporting ATPase subunit a